MDQYTWQQLEAFLVAVCSYIALEAWLFVVKLKRTGKLLGITRNGHIT